MHLLSILINQVLVNMDLGWGECDLSDELEGWVANQLASQPQERLLKVVV